MIAGYLAGFSGTIVGYPLDSLKVWVQTNTLGKNQHLESNHKQKKTTKGQYTLPTESKKRFRMASDSRRSNSTKAIAGLSSSSTIQPRTTNTTATLFGRYLQKPATTVFRTVRALYSGVSGPLVTVGMVQSFNFCTYDATRRFLYYRKHPHSQHSREYLTQDSLSSVALSGSAGGMATALLTAPLLMIKIHQQITGNSFRTAIQEIFVVGVGNQKKFSPLRPYGVAFLPHAASETLGRAIYVSAYEGSKRYLLSRKEEVQYNTSGTRSTPQFQLSLRERMVCAATSGILCWAAFFPLDALRNNMYHSLSRGKTTSIFETMERMYRNRAFYRGFSISILRAGPVAASVLPVYDLSLEWLSSE